MPTSDLQRALDTLSAKGQAYSELWAYYDNTQPLKYSANRLRDVFQGLDARFSLALAGLIVDTNVDRIVLEAVDVPEDVGNQEELAHIIEDSGVLLDSDDIHRCALVTGEAYVIVEALSEEEGGIVEAYFNESHLVHMFYDPARPRRKSFAAKWWDDPNTGRKHVTLYYPDRIEYYQQKKEQEKDKPSGLDSKKLKDTQFERSMEPQENTYPGIPVFHYRTERRRGKSLIKSFKDTLDAVNKLMADMMVSAEFSAFRQRYIISQADIEELISNPFSVWNLPAKEDPDTQPTEVGEFDVTDLSNFTNAIMFLLTIVAAVARVPKHLFAGTSGQLSGEALIAMEAPLNKAVQAYIEHFTTTWKEVVVFIADVAEFGEINQRDVIVRFTDPQTVQPRTEAEIMQIKRTAGLALATVLREAGRSEAEIEAALDALDDETARQNKQLSMALLEAERESTNDPPTGSSAAEEAAVSEVA